MTSLPVRGELVLALLLRTDTAGVTTTKDIRRVLDPRRGKDDTEYGTLTYEQLTGDWAYTFRRLDKMGLVERDMDVTTPNGGQGAPPLTLTEKGQKYAQNLLEAKKWEVSTSEVDETLEALGTDLSELFREVATMETRLDSLEEDVEDGNFGAGQSTDTEALDQLQMRVDRMSNSVDEIHEHVDRVSNSVDNVKKQVKKVDTRADHTERLVLGMLKMNEENIEGRYGICIDCGEWSELATMNSRREGYCLEHAKENRMLRLDEEGKQIIPDHHSKS